MEAESVDGIAVEKVYDVDNTIFVAVGKNVEKSKATLLWVVQSFAGKKICVLHVHQPSTVVTLTERKLAADELKQDTIEFFHDHERREMHNVLDQYRLILAIQFLPA